MARNNVNGNIVDTVAGCAQSKEFSQLPEEVQKIILEKLSEQESKTGGLLGYVFGTDEKKAIVYSAILIVIVFVCCWLFLQCRSDNSVSVDCRILETAIMTVLGFLFGSGVRK